MEQHITQEGVWRIFISNMMKKRNFIIPVIGKDTILCKDDGTGRVNITLPSIYVYNIFKQAKDDSKSLTNVV